MKVTPFIMGSGRSADALRKSLLVIGTSRPEWWIDTPVQLTRGQRLENVSELECPVLFIANPHGLHAQSILEGERAGFRGIVVEKPACINAQEIIDLQSVKIPVAVLHVYRQMWGMQKMKQMLDSGEFGELIAIEGRYWQASAAQQALSGVSRPEAWKNDPKVSGAADTIIDTATHWVDAASYLMGEQSFTGTQWRSYANAETPHRDTHVQLTLEYSRGRRAMASVSKTMHGATNHFEVNVLGTKKSATWNFLNPDEILVGNGSSRSVLVRQDNQLGSRQSAFHAMGWIEGYIEIVRQLLSELETKSPAHYPALSQNLVMLESLFRLSSKSRVD